jgi:very-short-patch-repair endonuclease
MEQLAEKEQKWGRVRNGIRVSPEEDKLAVALIGDGFRIQRQRRIFLKGLANEAGAPYYRVDFLVEGKVVIEVDSYTHRTERADWDSKRNRILTA